jgi:hypothetical protein
LLEITRDPLLVLIQMLRIFLLDEEQPPLGSISMPAGT